MRVLGVLVGSALAVAALVVFVGIPEFTTESGVTETAVITLPMRSASPPPQPAPASPADPAQQATVASEPPDAAAAPEFEPEPADGGRAVPDAATDTAPEAPAATLQWYAFWSPFRSEVAANGFVDQLQRVTGLDYRVVKVKPGVYEVAFAYENDQEITANLSQISAATGLELPES